MAFSGRVHRHDGAFFYEDIVIDTSQFIDGFEAYMDPSFYIFAHNELARLADPYVPMDTGVLATTIEVTPEYLRYIQIYAHYQYVGDHFNFSREMHPLATSRWDQVAMENHRDAFIESLKNELIKRVRSA